MAHKDERPVATRVNSFEKLSIKLMESKYHIIKEEKYFELFSLELKKSQILTSHYQE